MKTSVIAKLFSVLLLCSLSYQATLSSSQVADRGKIVGRVSWGQEPIEIVDLRLHDKSISFGRPFDSADETWMRGLRFQVKNTSNKSIKYLRFELQFPLRNYPRQMYYVEPVEYGKDKASTSSAIKPGESIHLAFDAINVDVLKKTVQEKGQGEYLKLKTVLISTEIVTFEDKTSWTAGHMLRFDDVSKKWIEITKERKMQIGAVEFAKATFVPKPQGTCIYKPTIEDYDCTAECGSGGTHHVSVPGEQPGSQKEVDKFERCNTSCLIAYTGIGPCS